MHVWGPLFTFSVFVAWQIVLVMEYRRTCPDCKEPVSLVQAPFTKSMRLWLEGDHVCRNCGYELGRAGAKAPAEAVPQRRPFIAGIGLLALAIGPPIALLVLVSRR